MSRSTTVFDIGLHKGEDTSFYLKKGFQVVAFEADPDLVRLCKIRFKDEIARERLHIVEGAITSEPGSGPVRFFKNDRNSVFGTLHPEWNARNEAVGLGGQVIEVNRVDLASCFERFGVPHFMKIDIEGSDTVVTDALRAFDERPAYLSIESNKVDLDAIRKELDELRALGYEKFTAVQQANIPNTRISTTDLAGEPFTFVFEKDSSGPFGEDLQQPWLSAEACLAAYREIFKLYRRFGDKSLFRRIPGGLHARRLLQMLWGHPLPGWYDTHAALPGP